MTDFINFYTLYFFYGLAFYTFGLSAILQNTQTSDDSTAVFSHNIYLGLFGLLHGVTEWLILIRLLEVFSQHTVPLYTLQLILNTASFSFLLAYGMNFPSFRSAVKVKKNIPIGLFSLWLVSLVVLRSLYGYTDTYLYLSALSRYFIGLPATVFTAYRFFRLAKQSERQALASLSRYFKVISFSFLLYGIFSGILITDKGFFPNNVINSSLLQQTIGVPSEFLRMVLAVIITVYYLKSIRTFKREEEKRLHYLIEVRMQHKERKRIARELHDDIIQELFASGLIIENMIGSEQDHSGSDDLKQIKGSLNRSIESIRSLMRNILPKKFNVEEFQEEVERLIDKYASCSSVSFSTNFNEPQNNMAYLSERSMTHLYYIIQEALMNIVKHAGATKATVRLNSSADHLTLTIADNGIGMDGSAANQDAASGHLGLSIIRDRADSLDANLNINSTPRGTTLSIIVPWRLNDDE